MAEAVAAEYRRAERTVVDEYIDISLSPEQATAILTLLRHAGGNGRLAKAMRPVFTGLAVVEDKLPDIPYVATHTTAKDGRPLVHFDDLPPETTSYDPPASAATSTVS